MGEDLLIIQKEFGGFDGTAERLDLLALDSSGRLVVIENKLDDTGRDVAWQAMKYAAYCSTLTMDQVVRIYAEYLRQSETEAAQRIADFLSQEPEELSLNPASSQRIMLVAAKFRREVTATALWLLTKGVDMTCIQVVPYQSGEELFLDITRIIPPPEAEDYMISMAEKSRKDERAAGVEAERHIRRRAYWQALIEEAGHRNITGFSGRSAGKDNWMVVAGSFGGVHFSLNMTSIVARVQFNIESPDTTANKRIFDALHAKASKIEAAFAEPVIWRRMEDYKASRIVVSAPFDFLDRAVWPEMIDWHLTRLKIFEGAMQPFIAHTKAILATQE